MMIDVRVSFVIDRPVEEVFAFLSDMESNLKWRASQVEVEKTSAGTIGVGTTYRMVNDLLGRRVEGEAEVIEYVPNRKYASISKSGFFPLEAQRIFEPVERGTRVTLVMRGEPGGFFKVAEPLVARRVKQRLEADAASAKRYLEADSA